RGAGPGRDRRRAGAATTRSPPARPGRRETPGRAARRPATGTRPGPDSGRSLSWIVLLERILPHRARAVRPMAAKRVAPEAKRASWTARRRGPRPASHRYTPSAGKAAYGGTKGPAGTEGPRPREAPTLGLGPPWRRGGRATRPP